MSESPSGVEVQSPPALPAKKSGSRAVKIVCWTVGLLVGLVGLLAIIGMLLPSRYVVEESIVVDAQPADIHEHVNDLQKWPEWSAWSKKQDADKFADLEFTYEGKKTGVGSIQKWTDPNNGGGELKIVDSEWISGIEYVCNFEGFEEPMQGTIRYKPEGGGKTRITWTARGDLGNNPINRWMFFVFKDMIAEDFRTGLSGLQEVAEADAAKRRKLAAELLASEPSFPPGRAPIGGGRLGAPGGGRPRPRGEGGPRGGGGGNRDPQAFIKRMMENDKNKDGKIAKAEMSEQGQRLFDRLDENKDGYVDETELKAAAARFASGGGGRRGGGGRPGGGRKRPPAESEEKTTPEKTESPKKNP